MHSIMYQGVRYELHTAAAVTPKPDDWEENKAQYIEMAVADLEALSNRVEALDAKYKDIVSTSAGELKTTKGTTGIKLDLLYNLIERTIGAVKRGTYTFMLPVGGRPAEIDQTTVLDATTDIEKLVNQWEKRALSSKSAPTEQQQQKLNEFEKIDLARKKEINKPEVMPKYVGTFLETLISNLADVYAGLKAAPGDISAALAQSKDWAPLARALDAPALVSFENFLYEVKKVSAALAEGKTSILRRPAETIFLSSERSFTEEWPIPAVVRELRNEYRHYKLKLIAQKKKEELEKKKEEKPAKEKKIPPSLVELAKELLDILADIQGKANAGKIDFLKSPAAQERFRKLKEDAAAVAEAVEKGQKTVGLSTGVKDIAEAVKEVKDATKIYKRFTKQDLAPEAREQARQESKTEFGVVLDQQIAEKDAEIAALRRQETAMAQEEIELLKKIKTLPTREQRLQLMRDFTRRKDSLAFKLEEADRSRRELVARRDEVQKKLIPPAAKQPEIQAPSSIVQTPEF